MKRKLVLLNVALVLLAAYAGWQWRQAWRASHAREAATLGRPVKPAPPPPFTPLPAAPPVVPSGYAEIVQKTLFDSSRNPAVEVELPPPPPPKPVPPLPVLYGILNLGDGPVAVLSVNAGGEQQEVRPGDPIGQFTLASVNTEEIAFEWDGQTIRKKLNELMPARSAPQAAQAAASGRTEQPVVAAPSEPPRALGPGADSGGGFRSCLPNDSTPAGTVVDGYRKQVTNSPLFGQSCSWVQVGR